MKIVIIIAVITTAIIKIIQRIRMLECPPNPYSTGSLLDFCIWGSSKKAQPHVDVSPLLSVHAKKAKAEYDDSH